MPNENNDNEGLQRWTNTTIDVLKHQKAICLLVSGQSVSETCKELGITQRTLQRWFSTPEFNQNLARAIRHVFTSSFAKAVNYTDKALDVLMEVIEDKKDAGIHWKYRLEAIKILLDYTSKGMNHFGTRPQQPEIVQRMEYQNYLLTVGDGVSVAARNSDKLVADRLNFDNSRAIWQELYPNEPYPENRRISNLDDL